MLASVKNVGSRDGLAPDLQPQRYYVSACFPCCCSTSDNDRPELTREGSKKTNWFNSNKVSWLISSQRRNRKTRKWAHWFCFEWGKLASWRTSWQAQIPGWVHLGRRPRTICILHKLLVAESKNKPRRSLQPEQQIHNVYGRGAHIINVVNAGHTIPMFGCVCSLTEIRRWRVDYPRAWHHSHCRHQIADQWCCGKSLIGSGTTLQNTRISKVEARRWHMVVEVL